MEQTSGKKSEAIHSDTTQHFNRSIGLISNFSLGFTYLSPLTAVYSLFALAVTLAGPPAIWWIPIVACGQLLVALVFGEVASQYPITGGLYPWARRLWGRKYAWIAAWIYLWALVVTITSVAEYTATFVGSLFGFDISAGNMLITSVVLLLMMMAINMSGTKNLARVARIGFWCEIVSVIALGIYLLLFHRAQPFSVVFDSMGVIAKDGSYQPAFMAAALIGLFMFFGFEACGNVAEEVKNPSKKIPVAMILSIVFGAISAIISILGYLLASPNLMNIVNGQIADPIPAILNEAGAHLRVGLLPAGQPGAHHRLCGYRHLHFVPDGGPGGAASASERLETGRGVECGRLGNAGQHPGAGLWPVWDLAAGTTG